MSLLMEALRKAEAAKNKAEGKDVDEKSKLTLEPLEAEVSNSPAPKTDTPIPAKKQPQNDEVESFQFELTPKSPVKSKSQATPDKSDLGNSLQSEENTDNTDFFQPKGTDESDTTFSSIDYNESYDQELEKAKNETQDSFDNQSGADELYGFIPEDAIEETEENSTEQTHEALINDNANEALEVAEELNQYERSKHQRTNSKRGTNQAVLDRQTANSLFQAKHNSRLNKRNKIIMLGLLLALLPIGGGGFYLYYSTSLNNNALFPASAEFAQLPVGVQGEVTPAVQAADIANGLEAAIETGELALSTESGSDALDTNLASNSELTEPLVPVQAQPQATTTVQPAVAGNAIPTPPQAANPTGGEAAVNSDFPAQAVPEIKLVRTMSRREINPDLLAAYESYQQSDFNQARRLYSQVLDTQANNRDALLGLALINRQEGNIAQAQALYSRLLQLNPRDPLARAGLLQSAQGTNANQQESELRALQREFPNVAPLAFALGNLYASQARWNEAQNAYFDALLIANEVDSSAVSPDYAFNLAVSLERLNQLALAYDYYQQALELSSASPSGFSMENLNQRLTYLERALQ